MATRTTISTVRHGHSDFNAQRRYAGSIDVPLSAEGIRDAKRAGANLDRATFDVVVTSTLKRAVTTARLLVNRSVPVVRSRLCNERGFGEMEGLTWHEVQGLQPPVLMITVGDDVHTVNPAGGEHFEDVWDRAKVFRRLLFRRYSGKRLLVVSHGVFLQLFHGLLRGLGCIESLAAYPYNLEMTTFHFEGQKLTDEKVSKLRELDCQRW